MKKLLAALMAAVMCAACFAGCTKETQTDIKSAADADDVTVKIWSGDGGAQAVWRKLVDEWNSTEGEKKNIFIDFSVSMDSQRIDVARQNETLPEITNANTTQMEQFIPTGDLIPINDLPGGEEFLKEYGDEGVEGIERYGDKQYAVRRKTQTAGLIYNKDLFKKAGIVDEKGEAKAPATFAEIREAAKKITDTKAGIYGFAFPLKFGVNYTIVNQTVSSFSAENPRVKTDYDNLTVDYSGYKDTFQWILDMKEDGSVFPGAETLDNDTARAYFASGIIGMIPAISWDVGVYTTQFIPENFEWDMCEFPILDGHERGMNYQYDSGMFTISKNALKTPEIAEATMEVYKFLYSLDVRKTLFENNTDLSCKTDVLEVADMSKVHPVFAKFAALAYDGHKEYQSAGSYIVDGKKWSEMFEDVWAGKISLDDAIADYSKRASEGLKAGVKKGTYDIEIAKQVEKEKLADWKAFKEKAAK